MLLFMLPNGMGITPQGSSSHAIWNRLCAWMKRTVIKWNTWLPETRPDRKGITRGLQTSNFMICPTQMAEGADGHIIQCAISTNLEIASSIHIIVGNR